MLQSFSFNPGHSLALIGFVASIVALDATVFL